MEKGTKFQPSESELEILQVLWQNEPCTVKTVHEVISPKKPVGYTTVLKQMQRMYDKHMLRRTKEGKIHYYEAVPKEQDIQLQQTKKLLNTAYQGSAMKLVMHALGQTKASQAELEELQKWIEAQKNESNE